MQVLAVLLVIIVVAIIYSYKSRGSGSSSSTSRSVNKGQNRANNKGGRKRPQDATFKEKQVLSYEFRGLDYLGLDPEKHEGSFIGTAASKQNSNDKFAVNIYNSDGKLIGFCPKHQIKLHNTIEQQHGGEVICWGNTDFAPSQGRWGHSFVSIPIGVSDTEIDEIKYVLNSKIELRTLFQKQNKGSDDYLKMLKIYSDTKPYADKLHSIKGGEELRIGFNTSQIPSMSKHFEKNEEWDNLLELYKHQDLISMVNEKNRGATLRRIEKAKNKVAE